MLEERIVRYCAPTLAGLKTGSLFNTCGLDPDSLIRDVARMRGMLLPSGVNIRLFFKGEKPALVYVYRERDLARDLADPGRQAFLKRHGYTDFSNRAALDTLAKRLRKYTDFPHEIGLFLSYPLSDVEGFVKLGSQCSKLCGYWCVYGNVEQAQKCFLAYDKSRAEYLSRYRAGCSLTELALAM